MLQAFEFIATLCAALFAGAALYINLVEHPARMGLETRIAALQWAPSYKRATWMQAPLALLSLLSGVVAWFTDGGVARFCRAYRGRGPFHTDRHHAHESQALGALPRSWFRRDSHALEALGLSSCGPHRAECAGHAALHVVAT